MRVWDEVLTEQDRVIAADTGYGKRQGFGKRPAVLVVDVSYAFLGDYPEPILDSIRKYSSSCGQEGWKAVYQIRALLDGARAKGIPVFYTTGVSGRSASGVGRWADKHDKSGEDSGAQGHDGNEIVADIAPQPGDTIIYKNKPSAFFGTSLISYLMDLQVDSLLVAGTTTRCCVRASVVDAFSYNLKVSVVEECVFDHMEVAHKISLFDMDQIFADVVSLEAALKFLDSLPDHIFPMLHPPQKAPV